MLAYHRICSCSRHTVYQTFSSSTCRCSCHAAAANTLPLVLQVVLAGLKGTHRHTIAAFLRPSSVWGLRQRQQILQDPRDKEYLRSEFNGSIWRAHMALKGIPKVPSQTWPKSSIGKNTYTLACLYSLIISDWTDRLVCLDVCFFYTKSIMCLIFKLAIIQGSEEQYDRWFTMFWQSSHAKTVIL